MADDPKLIATKDYLSATGANSNLAVYDQQKLDAAAQNLGSVTQQHLDEFTNFLIENFLTRPGGNPLTPQQAKQAVLGNESLSAGEKDALNRFFTAMADLHPVQAPPPQTGPTPAPTPPTSSPPAQASGYPDLLNDQGLKSVNLSVKDKRIELKFYDSHGNNLVKDDDGNDKTIKSNELSDGVTEAKVAAMVNGLSDTQKLALAAALTSDNSDTQKRTLNVLASGDQHELNRILTPPTPELNREDMMKKMSDWGFTDVELYNYHVDLATDEYVKGFYSSIKNNVERNGGPITDQNAKAHYLNAAQQNAAGDTASQNLSGSPKFKDLSAIAKAMGRPDLNPILGTARSTAFDFYMSQLSGPALSAFRETFDDSLREANARRSRSISPSDRIDLNHVTPDDWKKAVDAARQAAINSSSDRGRAGDLLGKAINADGSPNATQMPSLQPQPGARRDFGGPAGTSAPIATPASATAAPAATGTPPPPPPPAGRGRADRPANDRDDSARGPSVERPDARAYRLGELGFNGRSLEAMSKDAQGNDLNEVHFAFDRSDLTADNQRALDRYADVLKANGNDRKNITVTGYTDTSGTDGYNTGLGQRRADAIKDYLVGKGIAADRITTLSAGKTGSNNEIDVGDQERSQTNRRGTIYVHDAGPAPAVAPGPQQPYAQLANYYRNTPGALIYYPPPAGFVEFVRREGDHHDYLRGFHVDGDRLRIDGNMAMQIPGSAGTQVHEGQSQLPPNGEQARNTPAGPSSGHYYGSRMNQAPAALNSPLWTRGPGRGLVSPGGRGVH